VESNNDAPGNRLADLIEAERAEILATYERDLRAAGSPIAQQAVRVSEQILTDVVKSVRDGTLRVEADYRSLAWADGEGRARGRVHPQDALQAEMLFTENVVRSVAKFLVSYPELCDAFVMVVLTLNESMSQRIRETTVGYVSYLLAQVHAAHLGERRRVARDLHDRLGEELALALRRLELHDLTGRPERMEFAKQAIVEGMARLREITTELWQEPLTSLKEGLRQHLETVGEDGTSLRLRFRGDERFAPQAVLGESFLIIREAIRNAVTHGNAQTILLDVDLTPRYLSAEVVDDGEGFDQEATPDSGVGIASMRERAQLLGGSVTVASSPGSGTRVDLRIPLLGRPDHAD